MTLLIERTPAVLHRPKPRLIVPKHLEGSFSLPKQLPSYPFTLDTKNIECLHRGLVLGVKESLLDNNKHKVYQCKVHNLCSIYHEMEYIEDSNIFHSELCLACPDSLHRGDTEIISGVADPIPDSEIIPRDNRWAFKEEVKKRHIQALAKLLTCKFPPPEKAEGEGVIICGGGPYWPMIKVSIKMLREVSDLPIQIWHRGPNEPVYPKDLKDISNLTIRDATKVIPKPRILGGWETKTLSMLYCGWQKVLYLDADAYCINDPAPFLALADEHRFVYWQDLHSQYNAVKWQYFGFDGSRVAPVQGGHLAIDLVQFRRELVISHWINQHSDYFYKHMFGDQDAWRVVLAATNGIYKNLGLIDWVHPAYLCKLNNVVLICHRCRGKIYGSSTDKYCPHLPKEDQVWKFLKE